MGGGADRRATYFFKIVLLFLLLFMLYCHLIPSISPISSSFNIFLELLRFNLTYWHLNSHSSHWWLKKKNNEKDCEWNSRGLPSSDKWPERKPNVLFPSLKKGFHVTMMILIRRNMQLFDKIVLSINNHTLWEWICEADNQLDKNVWLLHRRETISKTCQFLYWALVR